MGSLEHTTLAVPPQRRLARWRDLMAQNDSHLRVTSPTLDFVGSLTWRSFGPVNIFAVETTGAHQIHRHHSNQDICIAHVQLDTSARFTRNQIAYEVAPYSLQFCDTRYSYSYRFPKHARNVALVFPRQAIEGQVRRLEWHAEGHVDYDAELVALLATFCRTAMELGPDVDRHVREDIATTTIDLLASVLRRAERRSLEKTGVSRAGTLMRIQEHLRRNLRRPDMTPAVVASELGLSVSTLQRAFRAAGMTMMRYVTECRLQGAAADLVDTSQSATSVAYAWGFRSRAHFTRCFVARYGVSPGRYRRRTV